MIALKYTPWTTPEAEVKLQVVPRLHKEGYFVGVSISQNEGRELAERALARAMETLHKNIDKSFRSMLYGDFTT